MNRDSRHRPGLATLAVIAIIAGLLAGCGHQHGPPTAYSGPVAGAAAPRQGAPRRDIQEEFRHLTAAAERGDPIAQVNLAGMYMRGEGIARDEYQARKWFGEAARQGDLLGQLNLGILYRLGRGGEADPIQARHWLSLAAERGNHIAHRELGLVYRSLPATTETLRAAVTHFSFAAEQGDSIAQGALGAMYLFGHTGANTSPGSVGGMVNAPPGTPLSPQGNRDYEKALHWLSLAARQGEPIAQFNLGMMHLRGDGVVADPATGYLWLYQAAENGHPDAAVRLEEAALHLGSRLADVRARAEEMGTTLPRIPFPMDGAARANR